MLATAWSQVAFASLGLSAGILLIGRGIERLLAAMNPMGNASAGFPWIPIG